MMNSNNLTDQFLSLLKRISEKKVYGSVEIFFEEGKVTQITQRVIKKINRKDASSSANSRVSVKLATNSKHKTETAEDSLADLVL